MLGVQWMIVLVNNTTYYLVTPSNITSACSTDTTYIVCIIYIFCLFYKENRKILLVHCIDTTLNMARNEYFYYMWTMQVSRSGSWWRKSNIGSLDQWFNGETQWWLLERQHWKAIYYIKLWIRLCYIRIYVY